MVRISSKDINDWLEQSDRPKLYTNLPAPLNDLHDRTFEILLYSIFRERLKIKDVELCDIADNVSLMQGVGEHGRDVVLSKGGKNTAIIQCKKYKTNFTLPDLAQEILKFILYYLHDKTLIGKIEEFHYYIAVSTGFTGTAIGALGDFSKYLLNEAKLKEWVEGLFKDYPTKFKNWDFNTIENDLKSVISSIRVHSVIPSDIEFWLSQFDTLNKQFFKVLTVTDNSLLELVINNYLKPILHKLSIPQFDNPDYAFRFKDYLKRAFDEYSSAKTLVFGNQQKKLEDIYYPLTVIKRTSFRTTNLESYKIDRYNEDFIPIYKKVVIIDDGGMGKSTLLKWLFLSIVKQNKGVPIFIELRNINREHDIVDYITSKLNPLDYNLEKSATAKILKEKGFIFLFDGFDEIKFENREFVTQHLETFIHSCTDSHFVITSRPEKALLAFSNFQEFRVRKLEAVEAFELIRKLDDYNDRSQKLIEQIKAQTIDNIEEFLGNPLLVSLLYKKFEYRESISFKKQEFYYEVFEALFQAHDLSKGGSYTRQKESNLSLTDFFQVLRGLGFKCIKEGIEFNEAVLLQLIDAVKIEFIKDFDSQLFLNDIIKAVPLFQRDGLSIKWAHKSIQQYFAAEYICRDSKERQSKILLSLYKSEQLDTYSNIIALCYEIDFKTFRNTIIYEVCKEFIEYEQKQFKKLKASNQVSEKSLVERSELLFKLHCCLASIDEENLEAKSNSKSIRTTIAKKWKLKQEDIVFYGMSSNDGFRIGLKTQDVLNFNIKSFLAKRDRGLFERLYFYDEIFNDKSLNIPLKENVFFFDNDDPNHELNSPEYFDRMNEILSSCTSRIDYYKSLELIKDVDTSKKSKDSMEDVF